MNHIYKINTIFIFIKNRFYKYILYIGYEYTVLYKKISKINKYYKNKRAKALKVSFRFALMDNYPIHDFHSHTKTQYNTFF